MCDGGSKKDASGDGSFVSAIPLPLFRAHAATDDRSIVAEIVEGWSDRMFTRVCKAETVPEGGMRLVIADAQLIVLAWPDDTGLRAFQGVCPHTNQPLADAEFDGRVLTCPSHRWTWDLTTGAPLHPQESALAEYPVKIEDGVVYIDTAGITPLFAPP